MSVIAQRETSAVADYTEAVVPASARRSLVTAVLALVMIFNNFFGTAVRRHRWPHPGHLRLLSAVAVMDQPVSEICEASARVAMMIGRAYSVVTTLLRSAPPIRDRLRMAGLWERCASVRATG